MKLNHLGTMMAISSAEKSQYRKVRHVQDVLRDESITRLLAQLVVTCHHEEVCSASAKLCNPAELSFETCSLRNERVAQVRALCKGVTCVLGQSCCGQDKLRPAATHCTP